MLRGEFFARVVRTVLRRPVVVLAALAAVVALALFGGVAARAVGVDRLARREGLGLLQGDRALQQAVRRRVRGRAGPRQARPARPDQNLSKIAGLEICMGAAPPQPGARDAIRATQPAPCRELAKLKPGKTVVGPGTFVLTAITGAREWIDQRAKGAQAAGRGRGAERGRPVQGARRSAAGAEAARGVGPPAHDEPVPARARRPGRPLQHPLHAGVARVHLRARLRLEGRARARRRRASPTSSRRATRRSSRCRCGPT